MGHLLDGFRVGTEEQRKVDLERVHPDYQAHVRGWNVALDAYDAEGGFLSGAYLWKFAREEAASFKARQAQARYHNYSETIIDVYLRHIMTGVTRETTDARLTEWWENVTGQGDSVNDYMRTVLGQALAGGHAGVLVDKAADDPTGPSLADDPNRPTVATFLSPAIRDWRYDTDGLAAIKLAEAPATVSLSEDTPDDPDFVLWDRDEWIRFDAEGRLIGGGEHGLGLIPMVIVRPKPSQTSRLIGKPLVPPSVVQALYNRASEEDLVLRDQAFSLFVVQVPADTNQEEIDRINRVLNQGVGTTTAVTVPGNADYRTADMQVPQTLSKHQLMLIHEMYRAAHMRFQRDSLEAESAEALRLQRQDLDQALQGMAEDMADIEMRLAGLYYAWMAPGDPAQALERADVQIVYPTEFSIVDIEAELTSLQAAMAMQLGRTAESEARKRVVRLVLPELSEDVLETVREEIEAQPDTGSQGLRAGAADRLRQLGVEVESG